MKILFLSISSAIKDLNNRGIYPDLINHFVAQGHELFIVCPVERRQKIKTFIKKDKNVSILGVKTLNITKSNFFEKGIATLLIEKQFDKAIKKHFDNQKFDLILYSTPPITFNSLIKKLKIKHQAKTYLLLKDIFPQNAVDLGLMKKNSLFYKYFRKKEKLLYSISDHIGCMSDANISYILKNNPEVPKEKLEICPNSIRVTERKFEFSKAEIFKKLGIPLDVPVFLYGGNLGISQGIDFLIEILEYNKSRTDFFIMIIGGGNRYELLNSWFTQNRPNNAKLIHHMAREEYDKIESVCDVGMIFLDKRFTIPNFPSRMLSYMESKLPLLICTDTATDIGSIAAENGFGLWSESGDLESFNKNFNFLIESEESRIKMGKVGFEFLKKKYDVSVCYSIIINHFINKTCS